MNGGLAAVSGEIFVTSLLSTATPEQHRAVIQDYMVRELTEANRRRLGLINAPTAKVKFLLSRLAGKSNNGTFEKLSRTSLRSPRWTRSARFATGESMTRYCLTRAERKICKNAVALALRDDYTVASSYLHVTSQRPRMPGPELMEIAAI
ncbi:unnamed protein product [Peronospora belbahrii]|uniref:Uncharacterized protein n=1 Tax=Peronospora belbahrii TaxID=622444 RepID=A0AAU9KNI6_9STRA|nr:unnamed protein product [Peronospora belbahrii]